LDLTITKTNRDDYLDGKIDEYKNDTTTLLESKINLFNGVKDYNTIQSQLSIYKQRKNKALITRDKVLYQVKLAWQKYMTYKLIIHYLNENVNNAKLIYLNSKYDLEFSKIKTSAVLDNIDSYETVKTKLLNFKYDLILAKYELLYAIGDIQTIISKEGK
jgi:outer membrane protein TolC